MPLNIPLKQKYLDRKPAGNKSHSNNNLKKHVTIEANLTPRRVNYGPFWWIKWNSQELINGRSSYSDQAKDL